MCISAFTFAFAYLQDVVGVIFMGTLKPQSNGPLVHWPLIHGDRYNGRWCVGYYIWYSEEEPVWAGPQSPPRCTKCKILPINGRCTNFILFDVAL